MGMNSRAKLCYGYYLGDADDYGWRILEATDTDTAGEDPWSGSAFGDRLQAAAEKLGLEVEYAGSYDYTGYILAAKVLDTTWGATVLDDGSLIPDTAWVEKLHECVKALSITPTNYSANEVDYGEHKGEERIVVAPRWILASFYG